MGWRDKGVDMLYDSKHKVGVPFIGARSKERNDGGAQVINATRLTVLNFNLAVGN